MYAISVIFEIAPDRVDDFKAAALAHAVNSKSNEPGCLAFDVFWSAEQPGRFYFHECYTDKAAVEEVHNKASYFAEFGKKVAPWIVKKERHVWDSLDEAR